MSIFDGIEHKAGAEGRGTNITPGVYDFEVLSCSDGVTKFTNTQFFKVAVKVLASTGEATVDKEGKKVPPLPVGTETEIFICPDKFNYFITEMKEIASVLGTAMAGEEIKPSDITEEDFKTLVGLEQPAKGVRFRATYSVKPGKFDKSGLPVSNKKYSSLPQTNAQAA